ncbi:hypothetical protein TI39_contig375g00010 [Zymoseptoria brevis]|uniref:Uncharacterized protein n=1 Tax=Zymoseptoria brevis TaxID=1047168 RepID=A0A0F4GNT4_9PEZI|nr:hypothetical protein TI39_contig375g00010 [Zymoseptoria brevis]
MQIIAITAVLASAILSVTAAPPHPRDEWQPADPNQDPPQVASVPSITSTASISSTTLDSAVTDSSWEPADDQTCIYMTSAIGWEGEGLNLCNPSGQCAPKLPDGLTSQVLSAGPSPNEICFLYASENCQGQQSQPLIYPGYANLQDIGFDNTAKSWLCYKMQGVRLTDGEPSESVVTSTVNGLVADQTTPGGLPVSSGNGVPTQQIETTTPGGLPHSTIGANNTQVTTVTVPGDATTTADGSVVQPTDVSSTESDDPTNTADSDGSPTAGPTTDDGASETDSASASAEPTTDDDDSPSSTHDDSSSLPDDAPAATFMVRSVTHTYADGETVFTTL